MSKTIRSFLPVADENSRVLILGSMPGRESLEKNEYYANKRNGFWKIVHAIFDVQPEPSYQERVAFLKTRGIAIWDVLEECEREGSSDNLIENEKPNDFNAFFALHPQIINVFFNGKEASRLFIRHVHLEPNFMSRLVFNGLTSTSPANARPIGSKIEEWRAIRTCLETSIPPSH